MPERLVLNVLGLGCNFDSNWYNIFEIFQFGCSSRGFDDAEQPVSCVKLQHSVRRTAHGCNFTQGIGRLPRCGKAFCRRKLLQFTQVSFVLRQALPCFDKIVLLLHTIQRCFCFAAVCKPVQNCNGCGSSSAPGDSKFCCNFAQVYVLGALTPVFAHKKAAPRLCKTRCRSLWICLFRGGGSQPAVPLCSVRPAKIGSFSSMPGTT